MNKKYLRAFSLLLFFGIISTIMMGCGRRCCCDTHAYCNPDGSVTYYRHYPGYTRECTTRTVYHPCTHYYHCHY